jgi:phage repressor protein C with HTH and peptisase S24 domain
MLRLLKIMGESLSPDFENGDFVIVSKIPFLFSPLAIGDVVAFYQPGYGLLIKRVQGVNPGGSLHVLGTQPDSTDSRVFGPVKREDVIGKVIWHIRKS